MQSKSTKGFLENRGQMTDMEGNPVPFVLFKTEAPGLNFCITESGITLQTLNWRKEPVKDNEMDVWEAATNKSIEETETKKQLDWERIDIELKGVTLKKENIVKEQAQQGYSNYFLPVCPNGIYDVKQYGKIIIKDVYPGIDWVFYRKDDGSLKYDFIVHPGGDYKQIGLLYKSKTPIKINEQGEIEEYTQYGNVKENAPISFYKGETIHTQFILKSKKLITINNDKGCEAFVSFELNFHDELASDLIIDPQLTWATFYGGNADEDMKFIDTDVFGNVFVTGYFHTAGNFPVLNPSGGAYFQGTRASAQDGFILKFSNSGVLQWATVYGGSGFDRCMSLDIDKAGNVFVVGQTDSQDFPVLNPGGGTYFQSSTRWSNGFILKFDNSGVLLWSTYYGGTGVEACISVAIIR